MFKPAPALWVDANQEKRLKYLVASGKTPHKIVLRARIILLAGEGVPNHAIAARLGTSRPTVLRWRGRFQQSGVPGLLKDARRPAGAQAGGNRVIRHPLSSQEDDARAEHDLVRRLPGGHEVLQALLLIRVDPESGGRFEHPPSMLHALLVYCKDTFGTPH